MDKHIYRLNEVSDSGVLEIYVCGTNDVEPYCKTKTVGFVFLKGDVQVDFDFEEQDLESIIKYLIDAKEYIDRFNTNARNSGKNNEKENN